MECLAVINDTVGALMSCAHSDRECAIGLILGEYRNSHHVCVPLTTYKPNKYMYVQTEDLQTIGFIPGD